MLETWRRIAPFILAGILLLNLAEAISDGGRANWLMVALLALILALLVWQRRWRPEP